MVKKAVKKPAESKKKKKASLTKVVLNSITETLQANSFDGEFELPSVLVQYNEKSHPRYKLGLHREVFIPSGSVPFYDVDSRRAMMIFKNQATIIAGAIIGEGIVIKKKEFDLPLCENCE